MRFFLLMLFPVCCFAAIEQEEMLRAKYLWESGQPERARGIYENLLFTKPESWKRSILEYNIAATYLGAGEFEQAAALLEGVSLGDPPFRSLFRAVKANLANARFQIALQKEREGDERAAVYFLRRSLEDIEAAGQEGLEKFREQAQLHLARILYRQWQNEMEKTGLQEGVPLLIAAIKGIEGDIKELRSEMQLERIGEQAESWIPLWQKLESDADAVQFSKAEDRFIQAIKALRSGNRAEAASLFNSSGEGMVDFYREMIEESSLKQLLAGLLRDYDDAAGYSPLQEARLQSLLEEQEEIASLENIVLPQKTLEKSMREAKKGLERSARFYFAAARQKVIRLLWNASGAPSTSEEVLERTVEEGIYALVLTRYADAGEEEVVSEAKEEALEQAAGFFPAVQKEQAADFEKRCQHFPWAEAIPLFEKGERAALRAVSAGSLPIAALYQEQAVLFWREALKILKKPRHDKKCREDRQMQMERVLRLLQQMEKDDRMPEQKTEAVQQGSRPW